MKKRTYLIIAGAVLALIGISVVFFHADDRTPEIRRIILISIDTCRADYLGCYGNPRDTTPNIDALAGHATLFKHAVSPVPITLPAHSSLLTGTIPPFHGVHDNVSFRLSQANLTLAEILKQHGFGTHAIVSAFVMDGRFGLAQGFDTYHDTFETVHQSVFGNERKGDETTEVALDWLDRNREEKSLLFLHYYDPHMDYTPPEPFASTFADNLYAGEIAFTDHCIGLLIRKLKELQLYDSTLLIVTGDHGEMLGEHGEQEHTYFIYEAAIKVPLIVKLPGQREAVTVRHPVGLVDIVPTLCSLLSIDIPPYVQGKDISPLLRSRAPYPHERFIYSESRTPTRLGASALMGVSSDSWKYIHTTRPELYDITADPGEEHNLINQDPQRARVLEDRLREILKRSVRNLADSRLDLDEETMRRLESLGYVGGSERGEIALDDQRDDPKDLAHLFVRFQEAQAKSKNGDHEEEVAILEELAAQRPEFHEVYSRLGTIAMLRGDYDQAVQHWKKLILLRPDTPKPFLNISAALFKQGDYKEAVAYCLEALRIEPGNVDAYVNLTLAYAGTGDLPKATETARKALAIAESMGNTQLAREIETQLELFERSTP